MRIRVGLVDDHPAILLGLSNIINSQPDMFVAGFGATVTELLEISWQFDAVLLDLGLSDGTTPTQNIGALKSAVTAIIAYSGDEHVSLVLEANRAGVTRVVRKSENPEVVLKSLRAAVRGESSVMPEWVMALDANPKFVNARLTKREAEVLALYATGETAERTGMQLFISRETVLDHIRRIRKKYALVNRPAQTKVDLFKRATEDGIVGVD